MMGIGMAVRPPRQLSLLQRALSAIRRNGGTLIMPAANLAGAFTDSTGLTPVTTVGDVMGLVTDRSYGGAMGSELVTNPTQLGLPAGGGTRYYYLVGKMAALLAGKTYQVNYTVTNYSGTGNVGLTGGAPAGFAQTNHSGNGNYSMIATISGGGGVLAPYTLTTNSCDFTNISAREVLGNHATQATTASKPMLTVNAQGKYAISFDGSNDFLQTGITTGNEGWVCAGVTQSVAGVQAIFGSGASSAAVPGVILFTSGGLLRLATSDGTTTTTHIGPAVSAGTPTVLAASWSGGTVTIEANAASSSVTGAPDVGTSTADTKIGANKVGLAPFNGSMSATVYTPVLPSAADRALIRRFVGSLQGQQL